MQTNSGHVANAAERLTSRRNPCRQAAPAARSQIEHTSPAQERREVELLIQVGHGTLKRAGRPASLCDPPTRHYTAAACGFARIGQPKERAAPAAPQADASLWSLIRKLLRDGIDQKLKATRPGKIAARACPMMRPECEHPAAEGCDPQPSHSP